MVRCLIPQLNVNRRYRRVGSLCQIHGHGTTGKDFMKTGKEDWIGLMENALVAIEKEYEEVSVVGHSMGGAIASILLSRHSEIKRGVLCCPGIELLSLNDKLLKTISFLSHFVGKERFRSDG